MSDEERVLEVVRALSKDPCAGEVAIELSRRSSELAKAGDPKQYTINKLWHLLHIALNESVISDGGDHE